MGVNLPSDDGGFSASFARPSAKSRSLTIRYAADHWCAKGHVMFCIEGSLTTELEDGRTFVFEPGRSDQVADGAERHRSSTTTGATLFCVD